MPSVVQRATEFLLAAAFTHVGDDGASHSFMFSRPGSQFSSIGTQVFFSDRAMIKAALFVRGHGAPHLQAFSVEDVQRSLSDAFIENYHLLSGETLFQRFRESYALFVSENTKRAFADALALSPLFAPESEPTVFPLVAVQVNSDFSCRQFFLRKPETLQTEFPEVEQWRLRPLQFPPISDWKHRVETPAAWLGIRTPALQSSRKVKRAILGAVALTPSHSYRHMFSGRTMWGGYCTIAGGWAFTFGDAVTPPLAETITIGERDHAWLGELSKLLASNKKADRRLVTALEYYYRAWPLGGSERFPILCMALDAAYSEVAHATAAVVDGVRETLGSIDKKRLRDLLEIRASVIHGGAPDVYDSRKYGKYYTAYNADPIRDLGLVVAQCLRTKVFGGTLQEHPEPYQDIIAEARAQGQMPTTFCGSTILDIVEDVPPANLSRWKIARRTGAKWLRDAAHILDDRSEC